MGVVRAACCVLVLQALTLARDIAPSRLLVLLFAVLVLLAYSPWLSQLHITCIHQP